MFHKLDRRVVFGFVLTNGDSIIHIIILSSGIKTKKHEGKKMMEFQLILSPFER